MKAGKIALMTTAGISAAVILGSTTASALLSTSASSTYAYAQASGYHPGVSVELSYADESDYDSGPSTPIYHGEVTRALEARKTVLSSRAVAWVDGEQTKTSTWSIYD